MPKVELIEMQTKQRIPLQRKGNTIGRADDNFVVLPGRHVSRHHCVIFRRMFGGWRLRQLGPKPGTQVGVVAKQTFIKREGRVLTIGPGSNTPLRHGDELAFGIPKGTQELEFTHLFWIERWW